MGVGGGWDPLVGCRLKFSCCINISTKEMVLSVGPSDGQVMNFIYRFVGSQ